MKRTSITLIILLVAGTCSAQSFRLEKIFRSAYSNGPDAALLGNELTYVVPPNISFLDTITTPENTTFKIRYFKTQNLFEYYLKKKGTAKILTINYLKLAGKEMEVVINITSTDRGKYFGKVRSSDAIDRRTIELFYNETRKEWEYTSTISYEEPHVGGN